MNKIIWILVDGIPHWLLRNLCIQYSDLNTLRELLGDGKLTRLLPTKPNCQTPPSLCSLFSGCSPKVTGMTGYDLPVLDGDKPYSTVNAFANGPRQKIDYIWGAVKRREGNVVLCHIPFVDEDDLGKSLLLRTYGFNGEVYSPSVVPISNDTNIVKLNNEYIIEIKSINLKDYSQLVVKSPCGNTSKHDIKIDVPLKVQVNSTISSYMWLTEIEGQLSLIQLGGWQSHCSGVEAEIDRHTESYNEPYFGYSLSKLYRDGALGKTLHDDGKGIAEALLVQALLLMGKRYYDEAISAVSLPNSDLVMAYQPVIDLALHELIGFTDPGCSHYTSERSKHANNLLHKLFKQLDHFVNDLLKVSQIQDHIIISSDHGMSPIDTIVYVNMILHDLKYLSVENNQINYDHSTCYYHPAETGLLVFNKNKLEQSEKSRNEIVDELTNSISAVTGKTCEFKRWDGYVHLNKSIDADIYLNVGDRCQAKSTVGVHRVSKSIKTGDHCVHSSSTFLEGVVIDINANVFEHISSVDTHDVTPCLLAQSKVG